MTLRTSFIIDLSGNLSGQANRFLGSLNRLGSGGSRSMQILQRSVHLTGQGIDRLGNRYTALLTGAAGIGAARQVMALETRFTRLGIQANRSNEEISNLKKEIYEAAKAPDIRVDPGEITGAIEDIVEKTGDLKFARDNIRNIGLAIQATGAQGKDIGQIMAEFQKMGIIDPKLVMEAMDTLNVQGKEGAFTLQNLASLGPRVVTAYTSMGRGGVGAIREMGAALQVIRMGTGSSEQAATAFEAVMRTLGDKQKVALLQKGGIKVFDPVEAKKGKEVLRPINELMAEIVKKTGGKKTLLSQVFDAEAMRAFNAASAEYQRTGSMETLKKFAQIQGDGTTTIKDSARAAMTASAAMTNLLTVWKQFADDQLTEPIKKLTEYLDNLKPGTVERWLNIAKYVALIGGGLILARKGFGLYSSARDMFGKGGAKAGGSAGGLGGYGGPVPVYVVNKHLSLMPDQWGGKGGPGAPGNGIPGKAAPLAAGGTALVAAVPAVAAATVAYLSRQAGKALAEKELKTSSTERLQKLLSQHNVMGGGPNSYQAKLIAGELERRGAANPFKGTMTIKIDAEGLVKLKQLSSNKPDVKLNVDTGLTMRGTR